MRIRIIRPKWQIRKMPVPAQKTEESPGKPKAVPGDSSWFNLYGTRRNLDDAIGCCALSDRLRSRNENPSGRTPKVMPRGDTPGFSARNATRTLFPGFLRRLNPAPSADNPVNIRTQNNLQIMNRVFVPFAPPADVAYRTGKIRDRNNLFADPRIIRRDAIAHNPDLTLRTIFDPG